MIDKEYLGDIIRERRKELKMTQSDLANRINVSDKTISKWESKRGYPDILILSTLANALKLEISVFFNSKELSKVQKVDEYDVKILMKYKMIIVICISLLIISNIIFLCKDLLFLNILQNNAYLNVIFMLLITSLLISSLSLLMVYTYKYVLKLKMEFNQKKYYVVLYQYLITYFQCLLITFLIMYTPEIINIKFKLYYDEKFVNFNYSRLKVVFYNLFIILYVPLNLYILRYTKMKLSKSTINNLGIFTFIVMYILGLFFTLFIKVEYYIQFTWVSVLFMFVCSRLTEYNEN